MRGVSLVLLATFGFDSTALAQALITAPAPIPAPAPVMAPTEPRPWPAPSYPESEAPAIELALSSDTTTTAEHTYPAGWNLVSVPLVPSNSSPVAVFDDVPAPLRLYDYVDGQVLAAGEAGFRKVAPGRAFWMLLAAPAAVRATGEPVATDAEYRIALRPGWNAVATPWFASIAWSDGQVWVRNGASTLALGAAVDQGWIEGTIDDPDPAGVYGALAANSSPTGRLRPWRGYLLYSQITGELIFGPPPPDTTPPAVSFAGLPDGAVVTAPTEIAGSIDDLNLVEWRLEYAPTDGGTPVALGSGNGPVDGALGTLDPTLLLNGTYDVRLVATDAGGQVTTLTHSVVVRDNMKVGNFTVSFVDLEVPLAGLPIRVVRTYDSRDKRRGDFGIGWRVELSNVRLTRNVAAGADWEGTSSGGPFPTYCIEPTRIHLVTITLPDGKVYEFEAATSPHCQRFAPIDGATVTYVARPGTMATLTPLGSADVLVASSWPGPLQLLDYSAGIFDPQGYRLTVPDGRSFVIDRQQGLQSITDANGNQLSVGPGGIVHSSGAGVAFTRDGLGRITAVTDPAGNALTYGYHAAGDLETFTDREANVIRHGYNDSHGLLSIEDPRGVQPIRNDYDDNGRLLRHIDATGKVVEYAHDVVGRQEVVTDRLGAVRVLEYDERGNVVRETDPNGKSTTRTFDERSNRRTETNPQGETTTWTYDPQNNVTSVTDARGASTAWTYNARGQVLTTTDPRGKVTTNVYDGRGNLLSTTDADGKVTSSTYDAAGNALSHTDAVGCVTRNTYDAAGNLTEKVDGTGATMTYRYDANGLRLTETRTRTVGGAAETLVTTNVYDRSGFVVQTTAPDGTVTRHEYDAAGQEVASLDELGRRTTIERDDLGRVARVTYADATTEETSYDGEGRVLTRKDRGGRVTAYEYDPAGRLVKTTLAGGGVETATYDGAGRQISTTDERGDTKRYEYDAAGNRTKVIDALGNASTFTYDLAGNQDTTRDARGQTTTFEYDALGRRTRTIYPDGTDHRTEYDAAGRVVKEIDPAGRVTQLTYDCEGRLTAVTDAAGKVTGFGYDELGNRIRQTDANGRSTTFEFDRQGRETRRTLPSGHSETREYDAVGNLIRHTNLGGASATFDYDSSNRLLARHYPDGTSSFTYTAGGQRAAVYVKLLARHYPDGTSSFTYTAGGQRAAATDARGITSYEYDAAGRLKRLTYPGSRRLDYAYDLHGNRTGLAATVGVSTFATSYTYDALNRPATVVDHLGRTYTTGYDPNGNRNSLVFPNGVSTAYTYDSLNRLVELTTTREGITLFSSRYTLGAAGNRTQVVEQGGGVRTYGYDALYRLVSESATGARPYTKAFTYDAVGNRLSQVDSARGTVAYSYDERDRLLSEGGGSYGWNDNGDLTSKPGPDGAGLEWDFDHRLRRVVKTDGTVITHAYDADGNRVRTEVTPSTGPPQVTEYIVDPSGRLSHVVLEADGGGNPLAYYVRSDDVLAVIRGASTRFLHADGHGSIRRLTDEAGAITDAYTYTAFGELLEHTGSDPNPYRFAGEAVDPNVGFYYNRARWLDVGTGRFLSPDPFTGVDQDPLGLHKYLYAHADPVDRLDPSGLFSIGNMCASISIQVSLFAMAHPTLLTVMGFVASALIPAEVSNSLMASGFPPFEAFGTTAQYRIRALQLIKNAQLRMQIRQALAGSNGRLSNLLGHTFEELVQKSLFPATAGARYEVKLASGRVIDVIWRNWMIELKTGKELGSRGGKQLASFAGHAADEGKDLIYLFLQKPTEAAIRAINKTGGIVAYIFE